MGVGELEWAGHAARMFNYRISRRILERDVVVKIHWKAEGSWQDAVRKAEGSWQDTVRKAEGSWQDAVRKAEGSWQDAVRKSAS